MQGCLQWSIRLCPDRLSDPQSPANSSFSDSSYLKEEVTLNSSANFIFNFSFLQLMANGRNGHIFNVLFLADKDNETANELVPTHPHQEVECTAQGNTSKRYIVTMVLAQVSLINVNLHNITKLKSCKLF